MATIVIVSGPIKSGKTTRLMKWASSKNNIDGILQPVIEEKRFLYNIGCRTLKQLEIETSQQTNDFVEIGKYKFSNLTFDWAKKILLGCFEKQLDYLIVDEIGKLEIEGKGFEPAISEIILRREQFTGQIIFVIRDYLLGKFIEKYNLCGNYEILNWDL
jgi:nucleoside-triphosphatase THEP1